MSKTTKYTEKSEGNELVLGQLNFYECGLTSSFIICWFEVKSVLTREKREKKAGVFPYAKQVGKLQHTYGYAW